MINAIVSLFVIFALFKYYMTLKNLKTLKFRFYRISRCAKNNWYIKNVLHVGYSYGKYLSNETKIKNIGPVEFGIYFQKIPKWPFLAKICKRHKNRINQFILKPLLNVV